MTPTQTDKNQDAVQNKSIARIEKELEVVWKRIDGLSRLIDEIQKLTLEVKVMGVNVNNLLEEQKELKKELATHRGKLDDSKVARHELITEINQRITELENQPGQKAIDEKEFFKKHVLTVIITGLLVFFGSILGNAFTSYNLNHSKDSRETFQQKSE